MAGGMSRRGAFADGSTADQSPAHQTVEGPKPDETQRVYDQ